MEYHELRLLLEAPSVRLLRAQNAPLVLSFLHRIFKKENRLSIPEGQISAALEVELEERRDVDPSAYPQSADEYLADWCSDSQGFLRRYYGSKSDEPLYELTSGSEKTLIWLLQLRQAHFVGTESRLESIFSELEQILKYASSDPDARIRKLEEEAIIIKAEIDRIRATGQVVAFTPVQINERYSHVLATARELLGDFRQVEDNFKRIAQEIAERHVQPGITKGAIVGHLLDSHDALRTSEQGQSFFAFWELLLSPERQFRFQEHVADITALRTLNEENRSNLLLHRFINHLLREGEKVVESHQRMSANLRRVLGTTYLAERRRVGELIQEIRQTALVLRDNPPAEEGFFETEDAPDIFATMSRPLWQTPGSVAFDKHVEMDESELSIEELRKFRNLPQIRLEELRRNIESCLARDYTITLKQVLTFFPPKCGMMEVLGYLVLADKEARHFIEEDFETIDLPPPGRQRWRVPRVLFCKG